jgi:hypothetical protein
MLATGCLAMLMVALVKIPPLPGGQSAVPLSRPGQDDLTFWANHNGLEQLEVEGEVGFGDMARILMRRRANSEKIRSLRDRFTFRVQDMAKLDTPDVFHAEMRDGNLTWRNKPAKFVIGAGRTFNLPVIVQNFDGQAVRVQAQFKDSKFPAVELPAKSTAGYFLRAVETKLGDGHGNLLLRAGAKEIEAGIDSDVRPLVDLRVRILDDDGRPACARVYLTASDGLAYAPRGLVSRMTAMSAEYYFDAEGSFEIELPAGVTLIEATRGQEYELTSRRIDLKPGQPADVEIRLKRWENMAAKGWYSADAHIHANYTAPQHQVITLKDIRLQTLAEDLNNANLMVANSGGAFIHDLQYFEGRPNALSSPNYVLYWNEEMRNSGFYGHLCLFNLKSLVEPLYTGFRNTQNPDDYPPNYYQAEAARKQGGAVTYAHPANAPNYEALGGAGMHEMPVDLALGQIDAMDVVSNLDEFAAMELWYRLLNCGFRLAISAGTDSFTNVADHYTPGGGRVYVHCGKRLDYAEWIDHYKRGNSFASNGPVILFTADGKEPGDEIKFSDQSPRKVRVRATVRSLVPVDKVEVVVNGRPVVSQKELVIDREIPIERSSWIAVRATGPWHRLILNDAQAFAHTGPVYISLGGQKIASPEDAKFYIDWIDKLIAQVNERGRFSTPERKQDVIALCRRAQEVYRMREGVGSGK